ncbi:AraC family transcriptional regulator [Sphingomonas spermidinifaciens]|uniref:AraC family transcriptional regulator n=2 Tax=Sphingomonas spermidinifaciens TaxID=1141889 RepID=A0A2A4BA23_9SPHN|nr:AraC family transcriptional regulator [Sphingomonas spermidinifaciens]
MELIEARGGGQGRFETGMTGVNLVRSFQTIMPIPNMYRPSLCVVLKGAKEILFGETSLHYTEMECLVVSVEVPAIGRMVGATPEDPYLGITIEFDTAILREVLQQLPTPPMPGVQSSACVFVGKVDEPLAECLVRLVRLMSNVAAVPVLYPTIMRELYYWLLTGPYGGELAKLAVPDTHAERVARAITYVRDNYSQPLRVEQLAEIARMSPSSFHAHFKTMTSMTPVQYQKQLRLLEARRLMLSDAANVSEAAYQVGYESASQFSREYTRSFGVAPKRDVMNFKALLAQAVPR